MALPLELQAELEALKGINLKDELAEVKAAPVVAPQGAPQGAPVPAPVATPQAGPKPVVDSTPEPVDPNSWSSAIGRGVDNMQADLGAGVSVAGQLTGSQYLDDLGSQIAKDNKEEAEQYGTPTDRSYKDVDVGSAGSIGQYLKNTVGEALPSMATVSAGALAGGKMIPTLPGKVAGSMLGGFLAGFGINVGAVENQMKEIDPNADHPLTALLTGAGVSALDATGAHVLVSPLLKHFGKDVAYKAAVQMGMAPRTALEAVATAGKGAVVGAAAEGATSAAQSVLQDTAAGTATGKPLTPSDILDHAIDAALGGAAIGAGGRAITSVADHVMGNADAVGTAYDTGPQAPPTEKEMRPSSLGRKIWDMAGNEATALLNPLAKASGAAKDFVETFRADMTGKTGSKKTIFEDQELKSGEWHTKFDDVTHGLNDTDLNNLFQEASAPKSTLKAGSKAAELRNLMDSVRDDARKRGGLSVGHIEGYMPFQIDPKKAMDPLFLQAITPYYKDEASAIKARDEWLAEVNTKDRGNTAPEVEKLVQQDPNTGEWRAMGRYQKNGDPETLRPQFAQGSAVPKNSNLEFSRAFNAVPQSLLNNFALNDSGKKKASEIRDYFEGAAHRIAFAERFGANGEKANFQIAKAAAEAQKAGKKVTKEEVDRMYDMVNAYNGMYGRIKDERTKAIAGGVSSLIVISRLPLAGLSTFTEFSIPFMKAGVMRTLAQVGPALKEDIHQAVSKIIKSVPPSETGRLMSEANLTFESATSLAAERIGSNMFSEWGQKASRGLFILNGMSLITHMNRVFDVKVAESTWNNNLNDLAAGLPFTSANGMKKLNQLREMGVNVNNAQEALSLIAPSTPQAAAKARELKILAIRRFVDQVTLDPTYADKPMWMGHGMAQMAGLLKGYPAAYGNIILPMIARRMDPRFTGSWSNAMIGVGTISFGMGLMFALGLVQDALRQQFKNAGAEQEDERDPSEVVMDVIMNQTNLQASLAWNMATSTRRGDTPAGVLLGPVAGMAQEASSAVYNTGISAYEGDPTSGHIMKFLYKQSPARPFAWGKEGIDDAFDIGN